MGNGSDIIKMVKPSMLNEFKTEKNKVNGSFSLRVEMSIPLNYMKMTSEIVNGIKREKERISTTNSGIWIP